MIMFSRLDQKSVSGVWPPRTRCMYSSRSRLRRFSRLMPAMMSRAAMNTNHLPQDWRLRDDSSLAWNSARIIAASTDPTQGQKVLRTHEALLRAIPTRGEHHDLHGEPDAEQQPHADDRVGNQPDRMRPAHETVVCSASRIDPPARPHRQFDRW